MPSANIAFISPSGEIGGAERALLLLLRHLDLTRYSPTVISLGDGKLIEALHAMEIPVSVVELGTAKRLSRSGKSGVGERFAGAFDLSRAALETARCLRRIKPDLIHTNGIKAHLVGGVVGRLTRRPVLWHMRDLVAEGRLRRFFTAAAAVLPHRIVAVSELVAAQFSGSPTAHRRASTVHDAVDLEGYRPHKSSEAIREELGLSSQIVLAMVAHFTRWKGHLIFLETLSQLLSQGLPVVGMIVGSSIYQNQAEREYETEVRSHAKRLRIEHRLIFTGFQNCVANYLNAADILIHPPVRPEPFGLAVIEAMALSKPVVATADGGMLETVEPGVTGLLVPVGDADGFAQAVASLVRDPERRRQMGRRGRERVSRLFTPGLHFERIDRVYQELLSAR